MYLLYFLADADQSGCMGRSIDFFFFFFFFFLHAQSRSLRHTFVYMDLWQWQALADLQFSYFCLSSTAASL